MDLEVKCKNSLQAICSHMGWQHLKKRGGRGAESFCDVKGGCGQLERSLEHCTAKDEIQTMV